MINNKDRLAQKIIDKFKYFFQEHNYRVWNYLPRGSQQIRVTGLEASMPHGLTFTVTYTVIEKQDLPCNDIEVNFYINVIGGDSKDTSFPAYYAAINLTYIDEEVAFHCVDEILHSKPFLERFNFRMPMPYFKRYPEGLED